MKRVFFRNNEDSFCCRGTAHHPISPIPIFRQHSRDFPRNLSQHFKLFLISPTAFTELSVCSMTNVCKTKPLHDRSRVSVATVFPNTCLHFDLFVSPDTQLFIIISFDRRRKQQRKYTAQVTETRKVKVHTARFSRRNVCALVLRNRWRCLGYGSI